MELRYFEPEDAVRLSQIIVQNLRQVLVHDYENEAIEALVRYYTPAKIMERSETQITFVGRLDDDLVGTASLDYDRVRNVFVDAAWHRKGIGRKLMTAIESEASQQHRKKLYLMAGISARGFYEKLGYRTVKRIDRDLDGILITEIQMEKVLVPD